MLRLEIFLKYFVILYIFRISLFVTSPLYSFFLLYANLRAVEIYWNYGYRLFAFTSYKAF